MNMSEVKDLDQKQKNDQQNEFKQKSETFHNNIMQQLEGSLEIIYDQSSITQLVLNKIETIGKTISQVLAIEMFKQFTNKIRGWSVYLLQNEIQEQRRNFKNLEEDCQKSGIEAEFQQAKEEFKKFLKNLEDLLQNQEHKQVLQNILQPPAVQSCIIIQPDMKYFSAIENYHYQSKINFHNSLQIDKTGQDLLQKIQTYRNELAKFLYFTFIEQGIKYLDQLLNYILIHKTQKTQSTLQQLNDYIRQLRDQKDKQQLMSEIQLIILIFPELCQYFQELYDTINDENKYFDDRIELKPIQFEIVMLIYDYVTNPKRELARRLSDQSLRALQLLNQIYRPGSVKIIEKLQKDLRKYIKQNHNQILQSDLEYLSELFISSKLRLFMKMLQITNVLKDSDIKYEYFHFNIISLQDQDLIQQCIQQGKNELQNIIYEPSFDEQQIHIQQVLSQFSSVIEFAANCEIDLNKNAQNTIIKDLKNKIKDSLQTLQNEMTSSRINKKLAFILNQIFWFQNLNEQIFLMLLQFYFDLSEIKLKKQDNLGNEEQIPNLYQLLLYFQSEQEKNLSCSKLINEISQLFSEELAIDFNDLIKEIEQFDPNNKQGYIKSVKQYYSKDFKVHLLNIAQNGTNLFQEAINFLISQIDP